MIKSLNSLGEMISLYEGRELADKIVSDVNGSSVAIDAVNKDAITSLEAVQEIVGTCNPLKSAIRVLTIAAGTQTWTENGVRYTFFHSNTGIHVRMQVENFQADTNKTAGCPFCGNSIGNRVERCETCGCITREHAAAIGKTKQEARDKALADERAAQEKALAELHKPMTFMGCLGTLLGSALIIFTVVGLISMIWSWLTES